MFFGSWVDYQGNWLGTVHFPDAARRYPIQRHGFNKFTGIVTEEFGVYSITVDQMEKMGIWNRIDIQMVVADHIR